MSTSPQSAPVRLVAGELGMLLRHLAALEDYFGDRPRPVDAWRHDRAEACATFRRLVEQVRGTVAELPAKDRAAVLRSRDLLAAADLRATTEGDRLLRELLPR